jgi:hypothetical protein
MNKLFFLPFAFLLGCGASDSSKFEVKIFDPTRVSAMRELYETPITAKASVPDSCVVSAYKLQASDLTGRLIYDANEEIIPDLSTITSGSSPVLRELIDAFNFKKTMTILNSGNDDRLSSVEITFKGLIKLCKDLWGGGGNLKTLTTVFYGSKSVNLQNFSQSTDPLCSGESNCIQIESFTTSLAPVRLTSSVQDFINTADKKKFVPIIMTHTNVNCRDDAAESSDRNIIEVEAYVAGISDPISSTFYAHPDDKLHFVPTSVIDQDSNDDLQQIILASVIAGDTYRITFTQGRGTGCTPGRTKTQTISVAESDVFNSSGTRTVNSVEIVFDWNQ